MVVVIVWYCLTLAGSGTATAAGSVWPRVMYGKVPSAVTGAAGSSASRMSRHSAYPPSVPSLAWAFFRKIAFWSSLPPPPANVDEVAGDPAILAEQRTILTQALESLSPDDRLAVQLYVVDEMPAEQVARALGYPSAKTVYNRVYRALAALRASLERVGIKEEGDV